MGGVTEQREVSARPRTFIIVQNLPVPFDRRVWLESKALTAAGLRRHSRLPQGRGDPRYEVLEDVTLLRYRPYAPGGGALGFVLEYAYSFAATAALVLRARRDGKFDVLQACNPPDIFWPIARWLRRRTARGSSSITTTSARSSTTRASGRGTPYPGGAARIGEGDLPYGRPRCGHKRVLCRDRNAARWQGTERRQGSAYRSGPERFTGRPRSQRCGEAGSTLVAYLGVMGPQDGVDLAVRARHMSSTT